MSKLSDNAESLSVILNVFVSPNALIVGIILSDNESSSNFLQYISKTLDLFESFLTDRNYMLLLLGLLLIFDIKVKEYLQDLTLEEGIRILIGDQDEPLYPVEKGISIEPGVSASISIKKVIASV